MEEQLIVLGDGGLWTAALGTDSALTESVFLDTTRWLEVTVDNFVDPAEALPRTKLNTSPYTFRAATVQSIDGAAGGAITGSLDVDDVLEVVQPSSFVGVNRSFQITGADFFGVRTPTGPANYGGMYMETQDATGWPFYGYATAGVDRMWHYYDGVSGTWHLWNQGIRLSVMDNGNVGIGTDTPSEALEVSGGSMANFTTQVAGKGNIRSKNITGNDPINLGGLHWAVVGKAGSNAGVASIGTAGFAMGSGVANTKYGIYGQTFGADGGTSYAVFASSGANGGNDYSGYFSGGDFNVSSPNTAGTGGVTLPNDAISDFEIEDEPGLANSVRGGVIATSTGSYVADSVEINCPTDGYVIVTGSIGWVNVSHTTGTTTELWLNINKTAATQLVDGVAVWRLASSHPSTGQRAVPLNTTRVYSETAGTKKYYLMYNYLSGTGGASGNRMSLRALFVPTLYGAVTLSEAASGEVQPGADVRTDGSGPLPPLRTKTITVADHNADIDEELADLRSRLQALEADAMSVTTAQSAEER